MQGATRAARLASLELFAARGRLTECWRRAGLGTITLDVSRHPLLDLSDPQLCGRVRGWIRSSVVRAVWISPPQRSWSLLARPVLRSRVDPWGMDVPEGADAQQVRSCNLLMKNVISIIRECAAHRVPCLLEAPRSSALWFLPELKACLGSECGAAILDLCAFGSRWRRSTVLLGWWCPGLELLSRRCTGSGRCSFGGRPHLQRRDLRWPARGWRHDAKQLPPELRQSCADILSRAADGLAMTRRDQLYGLRPG